MDTNTILPQDYSDMGSDKLEVVQYCQTLAPSGIFVDVGVRKGGTALLSFNTNACTKLICIDPYLQFNDMQGRPIEMDADWYEQTKQLLDKEAERLQKPYTFHKMTSEDYIKIADLEIKYAFVLLDGAHVDDVVAKEIQFFLKHMEPNGVILVDNTDWLNLSFDDWNRPRFDMAYRVF